MRNFYKKQTNRISPIFVAILLLLAFSFNGQNAFAQCKKTGYFPNGGSITLDTNYNAGGYSFWYYEMLTNFSNGLSHTNFLVNSVCIKNAIGGTYIKRYDTTLKKIVFDTTIKNSISVDKDGSYKPLQHYGIKFGIGAGKKDTLRIWFRLDKTYEKDIMPVMVKYSTKFDSTSVCGPSQSCAVPIMLGNISAEAGDGIIILRWTTFTELNNEKFEIERCTQNSDWIKIGEIAGGGNSSQKRSYKFVDNNPLVVTGFYRIKQIDFNGVFTYLPIVSVKSKNKPGMEIYPNPGQSDNAIVINTFGFSDDNHTVKIYNSNGKLILSWKMKGMGNIIYPILPKGIYTVLATGLDDMGRESFFRQRLLIH